VLHVLVVSCASPNLIWIYRWTTGALCVVLQFWIGLVDKSVLVFMLFYLGLSCFPIFFFFSSWWLYLAQWWQDAANTNRFCSYTAEFLLLCLYYQSGGLCNGTYYCQELHLKWNLCCFGGILSISIFPRNFHTIFPFYLIRTQMLHSPFVCSQVSE